MKTKFLPLLALPLLLGACSSFNQITTARLPNTPPAVRAEDKDSAWGKFPSYDPKGQFFVVSLRGHPVAQNVESVGPPHDGTATVDLLVNRDGTVEAAAIVASSGDPMVDNAAVTICRNGRYTLRLGRDDPAPYVVSQTVVVKGLVALARNQSADSNSSNYSPYIAPPRPTPNTPRCMARMILRTR